MGQEWRNALPCPKKSRPIIATKLTGMVTLPSLIWSTMSWGWEPSTVQPTDWQVPRISFTVPAQTHQWEKKKKKKNKRITPWIGRREGGMAYNFRKKEDSQFGGLSSLHSQKHYFWKCAKTRWWKSFLFPEGTSANMATLEGKQTKATVETAPQ